MNKLVKIIDGYYASGKTAFCKDFIKKHNNYFYLCIDSLLTKFKNEKDITNAINSILLNTNSNIIIDFYFKLKWKNLMNNILLTCKMNNYNVEYLFMPSSIEESFERYNKRIVNSGIGREISFEEYKNRIK